MTNRIKKLGDVPKETIDRMLKLIREGREIREKEEERLRSMPLWEHKKQLKEAMHDAADVVALIMSDTISQDEGDEWWDKLYKKYGVDEDE